MLSKDISVQVYVVCQTYSLHTPLPCSLSHVTKLIKFSNTQSLSLKHKNKRYPGNQYTNICGVKWNDQECPLQELGDTCKDFCPFSEYLTVHQSSLLRRIAEITNQTSWSQFPSTLPCSPLTAFFTLLGGHEVCSQSNGRAHIVIAVGGWMKMSPEAHIFACLVPSLLTI